MPMHCIINTLFILGIYLVVLLNLNEKLQVKKLKRNSTLIKTKWKTYTIPIKTSHRRADLLTTHFKNTSNT